MERAFKIFLFVALVLSGATAQGWDFNKDIRQKQQAKDAKRWSLSEWLDQKGRNQLMDTWLLYNTPSPYEFYLGVDTSVADQVMNTGNASPSQTFRNYRGAFAAWVTMVGLYGEYETSDEELEQWKALFMVRLLGSSDQSTNLSVHYGLTNQTFNDDPVQFQTAGGAMTLYLVKAFALTARYDYYFQGTSEAEVEQQGYRWEGGAFIEYGALRIYGSWFQENIEMLSPVGGESTRIRQGLLYGTRLYF